jgi:nucleotide-binding universal stress UspA family protein
VGYELTRAIQYRRLWLRTEANMKILLPLDLIQPVEPIAAALSAYVDLANCDVKLLYVNELLPAYENSLRASGHFSDDWKKEWGDTARGKLGEAEKLLQAKCKSVSVELLSGPTAMTIESVARGFGAELTVLTPRKKAVPEKMFGGSVSSKVVAHAPGTVLILRGDATKLSTVVVGHDGSENSKHAITTAVSQLRIKDAGKVVLCHAVDLAEPIKLLGPLEFVGALEQNALMQGEVYLADGEKLLVAGGVKKVDLQLIEADPAEGMITMAKDSSADLVVIGAQGHSAVQHFLIGSVSHKVATHSPCSVAVVKPASHKK